MSRYIRKPKKNYVSCIPLQSDEVVQNGLAYTPSDMMELTKKGVPVSLSSFSEDCIDFGDTSHSFDIPLENQRFHDPAKLWQESYDIKKRFRESVNRDQSFKQSSKSE